MVVEALKNGCEQKFEADRGAPICLAGGGDDGGNYKGGGNAPDRVRAPVQFLMYHFHDHPTPHNMIANVVMPNRHKGKKKAHEKILRLQIQSRVLSDKGIKDLRSLMNGVQLEPFPKPSIESISMFQQAYQKACGKTGLDGRIQSTKGKVLILSNFVLC